MNAQYKRGALMLIVHYSGRHLDLSKAFEYTCHRHTVTCFRNNRIAGNNVRVIVIAASVIRYGELCLEHERVPVGIAEILGIYNGKSTRLQLP